MELLQLQKYIYESNILTDQNGNVYILPLEEGFKFHPISQSELSECLIISKDQLIGLLKGTLQFNPKTQLIETRPYDYREEKARIKKLKKLLADTDYQAIKYAEGVITDAEFEETRLKRIAWRAEINGLEAIING